MHNADRVLPTLDLPKMLSFVSQAWLLVSQCLKRLLLGFEHNDNNKQE